MEKVGKVSLNSTSPVSGTNGSVFRFALSLYFFWQLGLPAFAQPPEPIAYTLSFPDPQSHYIEVEAIVPTNGHTHLELMMAVWTPGSYLIREYSRNVEELSAHTPTGSRLLISSSRKNRWMIETQKSSIIILNYRVYSREMSVRTNWVDDRFALVNGAPTFLTIADDIVESRPHDVLVQLPSSWEQSVTALRPTLDGRANSYRANSFDELVDSPIVAGNPAVHEFTVAGVPHSLVNVGESELWDGQAAAIDVQKIVKAQYEMWGFFPYENYLFINMITEAGGGIEHKASTVIMTSRWQMLDRSKYLAWLTLVSHELFHAWNVKDLRPIELGPLDYENEVHTRSLWMSEGLTDYYGALLVHRAGLSTRNEYFLNISRQIHDLQTTPGRLVQSVEQASYDAWTKQYRPNENSTNVTVDYYTKGAVIGFLLDAKIRKTTGGAKTLDDVLKLAHERYSGQKGFTVTDFRQTVEDGAAIEIDFDPWFIEVLETSTELDYTEALNWFGLALVQSEPGNPKQDLDNTPLPGWLGLGILPRGDNIVVTNVTRNTPGYASGFSVDDEILAIDSYRIRAREWQTRLELYRPGQKASVLISRRGELRRLPVTFGTAPQHSWKLEPRKAQTPAQVYRVNDWLGT